VAGAIEEARAKALGLKAIIDEAQRANANRQIRIFARQIAAAVAADRQKGGSR
jgi:type IV secretory pathway TrbL component